MQGIYKTYRRALSAQLEADFDHVNRLDDTGCQHSTGTTIDERLDGGP